MGIIQDTNYKEYFTVDFPVNMSFNFRTLPPLVFCLKLLFFRSSVFCVLLLKHNTVCKNLNLTVALKLVAKEPDRYLKRLWKST